MLIRLYRASDLDAVISLWHDCELTRPWNDPRRDIARKLGVQPELFLVGAIDDRVMATVMAGYEGHRGWVNYLAVAHSHRGLGHGSALMTHIESLLTERGCPKLNLQIRTSNTEALAFYRRLGFVQDEVASFGKRLIADGAPG